MSGTGGMPGGRGWRWIPIPMRGSESQGGFDQLSQSLEIPIPMRGSEGYEAPGMPSVPWAIPIPMRGSEVESVLDASVAPMIPIPMRGSEMRFLGT